MSYFHLHTATHSAPRWPGPKIQLIYGLSILTRLKRISDRARYDEENRAEVEGTAHIKRWWRAPMRCETRVCCTSPRGGRRHLPLPPLILAILRLRFWKAIKRKCRYSRFDNRVNSADVRAAIINGDYRIMNRCSVRQHHDVFGISDAVRHFVEKEGSR